MNDPADKLILKILELHDQGQDPDQIKANLAVADSQEAVWLLKILAQLELLKATLPSPATAFAKTLAALSNPQPQPEKKWLLWGYNIFRRKRSSPA